MASTEITVSTPDTADEHWSDAPESLEGPVDGKLAKDAPRADRETMNAGLEDVQASEHEGISDSEGVRQAQLHLATDQAQTARAQTPPASATPSRLPDGGDLMASVHSLPAVHITEPTSPGSRPATSHSHRHGRSTENVGAGLPPPSPARTHMSQESANERRIRHRSAVDARASNRLSGFFSNLIHRRDHPPSGLSRHPGRDENSSATLNGSASAPQSRSASPVPATRPSTPPPSLPAPSLKELGLTLSVLASDTSSSSHFSTPPHSGAFLSPHYLLLCHNQGLDFLSLDTPFTPQPYALVRRVSFKSVVVMEHRGVLVAIAGRRDGVRVYALEEVKKAIEWRMEAEIRRQRDRQRREEEKARKPSAQLNLEDDHVYVLHDESKAAGKRKNRLSAQLPASGGKKSHRGNQRSKDSADSTSSAPIPRAPTTRRRKPPSQTNTPVPPVPPVPPIPPVPPMPSTVHAGPPPPYVASEQRTLRSTPSVVSLHRQRRSRSGSVTEVLAGAPSIRRASMLEAGPSSSSDDMKADAWTELHDGDEEAIDIVAAETSGSAALEERTSAMPSVTSQEDIAEEARAGTPVSPTTAVTPSRPRAISTRRPRPSNLDLTVPDSAPIPPPEPSPVPTLHTLRQTLSRASTSQPLAGLQTSGGDDEDEEDGAATPRGDSLTLMQALLESRLPDLPPVGSRRPQRAIILGQDDDNGSPRSSEGHVTGEESGEMTLAQMLMESRLPDLPPPGSRVQQDAILLPSEPSRDPGPLPSEEGETRSWVHVGDRADRRRRRRWSATFFLAAPQTESPVTTEPAPLVGIPVGPTTNAMRERHALVRSQSSRSRQSAASVPHLPRANSTDMSLASASPRPSSASGPGPRSLTDGGPGHSRFIAKLLTNVFANRRHGDGQRAHAPSDSADSATGLPPPVANTPVVGSAPPKLDYVKLPGTKGALMIKAVETAKKSFLAILCGEHGEKVELFAGTYRSALGLSRTFILPDSPRSLELQLQGDDLVEVFLVFAQNVFALEPATVRVREVRVGRSELRALRRRHQRTQAGSGETPNADDNDGPNNADEDANVSVSIGVSVTAAASDNTLGPAQAHPAEGPNATASPPVSPLPGATTMQPSEPPSSTVGGTSTTAASTSALPQTDEVAALIASQTGTHTTWQQLSFAPNFPLAAIVDEHIIPPTYPAFLDYRAEHEPDDHGGSTADLAQVQFSPPGLPAPSPSPPSKWFYKDPTGVIHGPWDASLMQTWYANGQLPPDLPVRKEEDAEYILLRNLRLQCVDPMHPFSLPSPPLVTERLPALQASSKPFLKPTSLLAQPRHFGPPALFFSSRGGHTTSIVDGRGKSVLKGRFHWCPDESDDEMPSLTNRMGDVKRLEAFNVEDSAVLVAMRQGGIEAVDFRDALLRPGDESRTVLPHFWPSVGTLSRRGNFVWRVGMAVSSSGGTGQSVLSRSGNAKKSSTGPSKSPARTDFTLGGGDEHGESSEEIFFVGRKQDEVYFCERNAGAYRLLRLAPTQGQQQS